MAPHVETVRFRRGETCTEDGCPAKKYYIENGKKTCTNGHEQFVGSSLFLYEQFSSQPRASHKHNKTKMTGTQQERSRVRKKRSKRK